MRRAFLIKLDNNILEYMRANMILVYTVLHISSGRFEHIHALCVFYSPKVVYPTHLMLCFLLTKCCVSYSPIGLFPTHKFASFLLTKFYVSYSPKVVFPTHQILCFLLTKCCVSYSPKSLVSCLICSRELVFPTHLFMCFLLVSYSSPTRFLLVSYSLDVSRKRVGNCIFTRQSSAFLRSKTLL